MKVIYEKESVKVSHSDMPTPAIPWTVAPEALSKWDSSGKNTRRGFPFFCRSSHQDTWILSPAGRFFYHLPPGSPQGCLSWKMYHEIYSFIKISAHFHCPKNPSKAWLFSPSSPATTDLLIVLEILSLCIRIFNHLCC